MRMRPLWPGHFRHFWHNILCLSLISEISVYWSNACILPNKTPVLCSAWFRMVYLLQTDLLTLTGGSACCLWDTREAVLTEQSAVTLLWRQLLLLPPAQTIPTQPKLQSFKNIKTYIKCSFINFVLFFLAKETTKIQSIIPFKSHD